MYHPVLSTAVIVLAVTTAAVSESRLPAAELMPGETEVFTSGNEGYHSFRIPALIVTPRAALLAFCEGRKDNRRDHGDLDLVLKRSSDDGRSWGPLELVYEEGGTKKITIGNPCPVVDQDTGTIWLPFCRDNDDVLITHSVDDGKTWEKPRLITREVKEPDWSWYATGPGVGIQLRHGPHKGRLVIPCDHEAPWQGKTTKYSHVFFSDDHGRTWQLGGRVAPHTNECQVVELSDGRLLVNMRNYWARDGGEREKGGMRAIAHSSDGGQTWSEIQFDSALIEPVCQASFLRYSWSDSHGKSLVLFSNPASSSKRVNMTVRLSYDEGHTWPASKSLRPGSSAYSCLTVLPDRSIGCLYEADKDIVFASFTLAWLVGKE